MYCTKCGTHLKANVSFCTKCGTQMTAPNHPPPQNPYHQNQHPTPYRGVVQQPQHPQAQFPLYAPGRTMLLVTGILLIITAGLLAFIGPSLEEILTSAATEAGIINTVGGPLGWLTQTTIELTDIGWIVYISHVIIVLVAGIYGIIYRNSPDNAKRTFELGICVLIDAAITWGVIWWAIDTTIAISMAIGMTVGLLPIMIPYLIGAQKNKKHSMGLSGN